MIVASPTTFDQTRAQALANLGRVSEKLLWAAADDEMDPIDRRAIWLEIERRSAL
jgi:hypothetical protein